MSKGRPTKLTPERQAAICESLSNGSTRTAAFTAAGIHQSTFLDWIARGETALDADEVPKGEQIYVDFSEAVKKAEAEAEEYYLKVIKKAAPKNWQAAAWWLERRKKADYSRQENIKHDGGLPIRLVYEDAEVDE